MKVIVLLALIGLSFAFNLRRIAHGTEKVADFIADHQKAIEEGVKTGVEIANDLSENGFFNLKKIADKVGTFVSKNKNTIEAGAQTVGDIVNGNYEGAVDSGLNTVSDATSDNQFSWLSNTIAHNQKTINEVGQFVNQNKGALEAGAQTVGDVVSGNYVGAVDNGIKTVQDATSNNQLFNLKKIANQVGQFVDQNKNTIEAGAQTVGDVVSGNYVGAVESGIKTADDASNNQFSWLSNTIAHNQKTINEVGQFVNQNKGAIESGAQTFGDIVNGNYEGAVDSGLNTVVDATSDNQFSWLSNVVDHNQKTINEVGQFVNQNKGALEAGAQTVGDVVSGNYVGAVDNGIKTVQDATNNQLFNLGKVANEVGQFVDQNKGAIESGAQTVGDIVNGNYEGAVDSGLNTVVDATSDNQFSWLSKTISHNKKTINEVGKFVDQNKGALEAGAQTVGDVVSGNYIGAVDNGIKTVNDATHKN